MRASRTLAAAFSPFFVFTMWAAVGSPVCGTCSVSRSGSVRAGSVTISVTASVNQARHRTVGSSSRFGCVCWCPLIRAAVAVRRDGGHRGHYTPRDAALRVPLPHLRRDLRVAPPDERVECARRVRLGARRFGAPALGVRERGGHLGRIVRPGTFRPRPRWGLRQQLRLSPLIRARAIVAHRSRPLGQ
jgi:hypothetical protein